MATPISFYTRQGTSLVPTSHCIGPWDASVQHGGPPSALLAGAAERFGENASSFVVVRVTVELLRPIGLVPLDVEVSPIRLGRQAHWLHAELRGDGRTLARATVVRVARAELALVGHTRPSSVKRGPETSDAFEFPFFRSSEGYHRAVEVRIAEGRWGEGPCTAWMKARHPLVAGEATSALEHLVILADASNGVAPALPTDQFAFINPELTVHLRRPPEAGWVAVAARSSAEPIGTGLVESELFDARGSFGRCCQSLVVRPV